MRPIKSYMYTPREIKLAHELAEALHDEGSLTFYLACTKKYSHRTLRKTLQHVLSIPKEGIRKSRGALFNHIISTSITTDDDETSRDEYSWD